MEKIQISLFKGYADTCPTEVDLNTVINLMRDNRAVAEHTDKHRYYLQQGQTTAAAREKASCPCFAVGVRFEGGKRKANICGWTGLCLVDIDHVPSERMAHCLQLLRADKHTLLQYVTISGQGIRLLCRYTGLTDNGEKNHRLHNRAFAAINEHYARLTGLECDPKCKNATRLSGLAHDAELFFNPDALPFDPPAATTARASRATAATASTADAKSRRRLKRATDAAARQLADEGVEYTAHHHNEYIMRTGYLLNAYGVAQPLATEWAVERFADYDGDVAGIFASCYLNVSEHGSRSLAPARSGKYGGGGQRQEFAGASVADIEQFLSTQASFRKNTVTGKCEVLAADGNGEYEELTDRYVNTLWCRMCKEAKPGQAAHIRAVLESEFVAPFNPFEEYFENLPPWDGVTDHIAQLAARVHVRNNTIPFAHYFKKWLVGMVASLFDKETVNHEILVLTGRQGIYKTTWIESLLPPELEHYHCKQSLADKLGKDERARAAEFGMINIDEIDRLPPKCLEAFKALFTTQSISLRPLYMPVTEKRRRFASFAATGNRADFLTDMTGNRRWLPFYVDGIDAPQTNPLPHRGMYAQALYLLDHDYRYWFTADETDDMERHVRSFQASAPEKELLQTYFLPACPSDTGVQFLSASEMMALVTSWGNLRKGCDLRQFCGYLRELGFDPVRAGTPRRRGYFVIQKTTDAVLAERRRVPLEGHVDTMDT